jgi:4-aminobutyrate aminotransferase-like enzyme
VPGPASYFNDADLDRLPAQTAALVTRRRQAMGAAYRLFYSDPIEIVRGRGTRLYDANGAEYLDAYNNVPTAGHAHPRVVEAICAQAGRLNTHTRYLDDAIVSYSEDLLSTLPDSLDNIMYTCTGSEANDLALRIAKFVTGGHGVIVTSEAYHGITTETAAISPSLGGPESVAPWVELVPAPDTFRGAGDFVDAVHTAIARLESRGIKPAALIFDTIFASDGILTPDPAVIAAAVHVVHAAGGLLIADEVQAGFGRLGHGMWGFETLGVTPDLVTIGKPMGSGQPIAAVISGHRLIDRFGADTRYFSTFAGNSVSIAAAQATLDVLTSENLIANARSTGELLRSGLADLTTRHSHIGDVRGSGLFLGIDIVADPHTKEPADAYAFAIVNGMRERRVLVAAVGAGRNVLKIRPPMPFDGADARWFLNALDDCLTEIPYPRYAPVEATN